MNNDKIASQLSEALVAVLSNDKASATTLVANVLRDLTALHEAPKVTAPKAVAPKATHATTRTRKRQSQRGRGPALSGDKLANFNEKAIEGSTTIADLGRLFGLNYQTAWTYASNARRAEGNRQSALVHPSNQPML